MVENLAPVWTGVSSDMEFDDVDIIPRIDKHLKLIVELKLRVFILNPVYRVSCCGDEEMGCRRKGKRLREDWLKYLLITGFGIIT